MTFRSDFHHPGLEAQPPTRQGFLRFDDILVVDPAMPFKLALVVETHPVGQGRQPQFPVLRKTFNHWRRLDQQAHFGIERNRTGIEIQRTDKQLFFVNEKRLGMQGQCMRAIRIAAQLARRIGTRLIQLGTGKNDIPAIARITGMHRHMIVGRQRIGENNDPHPLGNKVAN
jgi:hypothetical protein